MTRHVAAAGAALLLLAGCSAAADPVEHKSSVVSEATPGPTIPAPTEEPTEAAETTRAVEVTTPPTESDISAPYPDRADQTDAEREELESRYIDGLGDSGFGGLSDEDLIAGGDAFCDTADDSGGDDLLVSWSLAVVLDYDDLLDPVSSEDVWQIATVASAYLCPEYSDGLATERAEG